MKKKILFVCMGNICRSPAAQAVFLDYLVKKGEDKNYLVSSSGTIGFHQGEKADSRMIAAAKKRNINITSKAKKVSLEELNEFDYVFVMDNYNKQDLLSIKKDAKNIYLITNYLTKYNETKIPDPYYGSSSDFDYVLDLLEDAMPKLLDFIKE